MSLVVGQVPRGAGVEKHGSNIGAEETSHMPRRGSSDGAGDSPHVLLGFENLDSKLRQARHAQQEQNMARDPGCTTHMSGMINPAEMTVDNHSRDAQLAHALAGRHADILQKVLGGAGCRLEFAGSASWRTWPGRM